MRDITFLRFIAIEINADETNTIGSVATETSTSTILSVSDGVKRLVVELNGDHTKLVGSFMNLTTRIVTETEIDIKPTWHSSRIAKIIINKMLEVQA